MRILILGYRGSGKTTAGDLITFVDPCEPLFKPASNLKSVSTSDILIRKYSVKAGIAPEKIIANKDAYREELWKFGRDFQLIDPSAIVREALVEAALNDLPRPWTRELLEQRLNGFGYIAVTGVRNQDEMKVCRERNLFDVVLWVARPGISPGPTDYLSTRDADAIILNNGTASELKNSIIREIQSHTTTKCDTSWICAGLQVFDR